MEIHSDLKKRLDDILYTFKEEPGLFSHNPNKCYKECEKSIQIYQKKYPIGHKLQEYHQAIDYITEKLGI